MYACSSRIPCVCLEEIKHELNGTTPRTLCSAPCSTSTPGDGVFAAPAGAGGRPRPVRSDRQRTCRAAKSVALRCGTSSHMHDANAGKHGPPVNVH